MSQIFDPLPENSDSSIVCCYVNATNKMQIARITNIPNWYFERVVFPGQRLMFESLPSAQLEIHCGMMASAILSDTIPCERLRIDSNSGQSSDDQAPVDAVAVDSRDAQLPEMIVAV
ncbi:MAG: DUF1830 domain-containing protein [Cyanobacteria bacterium J06627_8]